MKSFKVFHKEIYCTLIKRGAAVSAPPLPGYTLATFIWCTVQYIGCTRKSEPLVVKDFLGEKNRIFCNFTRSNLRILSTLLQSIQNVVKFKTIWGAICSPLITHVLGQHL